MDLKKFLKVLEKHVLDFPVADNLICSLMKVVYYTKYGCITLARAGNQLTKLVLFKNQ